MYFLRPYAASGVSFLLGAEIPRARLGVLYAGVLFNGFHALLHVADMLSGRLPSDHWVVDLPVFLPALLLLALCHPRFHRA